MFDIWFIVSLFLFLLLCFFEIIIFNEEIMLALCFFSFVFFCFNSLGNSITDTFTSRAMKFEADILFSYNVTKQSFTSSFEHFLRSLKFWPKFMFFISKIIPVFFAQAKNYYTLTLKQSLFLVCAECLTNLSLLEKNITSLLQKQATTFILYPLLGSENLGKYVWTQSLNTKAINKATSILKQLTK